VQLRMPFDSSDHQPPSAGRSPGPVGILTQRFWYRAPLPDPDTVERLRQHVPLDITVSDRLLTILANRGLVDAAGLERFFYSSLDQLTDPFLLAEMDRAVSRLLTAARTGQRVAVHGDFDVDGITGCALLTEMLQQLSVAGCRVTMSPAFIPDRGQDGYGVADRMIREWATAGVDLLLTVDTGSTAYEEVALARELGLDVIVLDHHIYSQRPPALAVINPCHPQSRYPDNELCGVAVAFKLVQGLRRYAPECLPPAFEHSVLDLVALGLVADQMALVQENRTLVRKGLARLADRQNVRPGLAALLSVAGLNQAFPITASDLAYQLAPRLNACGRIGRVMTALELLLTADPVQAQALAQEADLTNQRRRQEDLVLKEEAIRLAEPYVQRGDPGLVLASPEWHKGIIGIGAARLVEHFQRPTVLIAVEGEEARGSARSIAQVDIKAVLDDCAELLVRYGGHAQAAGMTLRAADVPDFRSAFLHALATGGSRDPVPETFDLALPLAEMSAGEVADHMVELEQLEPFGTGNPRPVYYCGGLQLVRPPTPLGNGDHLRFAFRGPSRPPPAGSPALGREFVAFSSAVAWQRMLASERMRERELLQKSWDILFQISRSTYRPRDGLYDPVQQQLLDIRQAVGS